MIKLRFEINQPINSVWLALTDKDIIKDWSGAPEVMEATEGSKFSLWGGDIWGINTKVIKPTTLMQDWFANDWDTPSKLTINLESVDSHTTRIFLEHEHVPLAEEPEFRQGWDTYYMTPVKTLLESRP